MKIEDQLYSIHETAKLLKVSSGSIRNLLAKGQLRYARVGHLFRIRATDIEDFLRRNTVEAAAK